MDALAYLPFASGDHMALGGWAAYPNADKSCCGRVRRIRISLLLVLVLNHLAWKQDSIDKRTKYDDRCRNG